MKEGQEQVIFNIYWTYALLLRGIFLNCTLWDVNFTQ